LKLKFRRLSRIFLLFRTGVQAFPEFFSDCSVQQLAEFMERAQPSCLRHPGSVKTFATGPSCGNAMLDPGEECDCGSVEVKLPMQPAAAICGLVESFEYVWLTGLVSCVKLQLIKSSNREHTN